MTSHTSGLTERTWPSVIQTPISISGHVITVDSTCNLKVKMHVTLSKPGIESEQFEIKRVFGPTTLMVGPIGKNIKKVSDSEKFSGGTLYVPEQSRNKLGDAPIIRAVYEEEPTIALRTFSVDKWGRPWAADNPFPVQLSDGEINIGAKDRFKAVGANIGITETTLTIPAGTKAFRIHTASGNKNARLTVSDISGGTSSKLTSWDIKSGNAWVEEGLSGNSELTVYITSNINNTDIQLLYWL